MEPYTNLSCYISIKYIENPLNNLREAKRYRSSHSLCHTHFLSLKIPQTHMPISDTSFVKQQSLKYPDSISQICRHKTKHTHTHTQPYTPITDMAVSAKNKKQIATTFCLLLFFFLWIPCLLSCVSFSFCLAIRHVLFWILLFCLPVFSIAAADLLRAVGQ